MHPGRVGSTAAINALMAAMSARKPDSTRIYSEPVPIQKALLACDKTRSNCKVDKAVRVFQDTLFLLGRTSDSRLEHVFYKLLPTSVLASDIMNMAYPETPRAFLYREPVEVLVSNVRDHKKTKKGKHGANSYCTEGFHETQQPSEYLVQMVQESGLDVDDISLELYCASYLVRYAVTNTDCIYIFVVGTDNVLFISSKEMYSFCFALLMSRELLSGRDLKKSPSPKTP